MVRVVIDGRPLRCRLAGVGQYVFNLALALSEQSEPADFGVLLSGGRKNAEAHRLERSISGPANRVVNSPDRRLVTGALRFAARAVPERALGGPFDLWHSTYFEGYPRPRAGRSLLSTIHDVIFLRHPELFARRNLAASHPALGRQVRDSTKIIAVSTSTRNQILELTSATAEQVDVGPLAVSVEPISDDDAKSRRGLRGVDRLYVLYVGSLEPRKDIPTLLRAWVSSSTKENFALILAGAPAYLSEPALAAIESAAGIADIRSLG